MWTERRRIKRHHLIWHVTINISTSYGCCYLDVHGWFCLDRAIPTRKKQRSSSLLDTSSWCSFGGFAASFEKDKYRQVALPSRTGSSGAAAAMLRSIDCFLVFLGYLSTAFRLHYDYTRNQGQPISISHFERCFTLSLPHFLLLKSLLLLPFIHSPLLVGMTSEPLYIAAIKGNINRGM